MFLDLTDVKTKSFEPPKAIEQHIQVEKAEIKVNGDIKKLAITAKVLSGPDANSLVFHDFVYEWPEKPIVTEIAKSQLKNLCESSGKPVRLEDVSVLVGAMCIGKVKHRVVGDKTYASFSYFKKIASNADQSASVFR